MLPVKQKRGTKRSAAPSARGNKEHAKRPRVLHLLSQAVELERKSKTLIDSLYHHTAEAAIATPSLDTADILYQCSQGVAVTSPDSSRKWLALADEHLSKLWRSWTAADPDERVRSYRQSAERGYATAQLYLAEVLALDIRCKDHTEAARWYRASAAQGNRHAQCSLGVALAEGKGVFVDKKEAALWFRKAAEKGCEISQLRLGRACQLGDGVEMDIKQAELWLHRSAVQGNWLAMRHLSDLLRTLGDKRGALTWLDKVTIHGGYLPYEKAIVDLEQEIAAAPKDDLFKVKTEPAESLPLILTQQLDLDIGRQLCAIKTGTPTLSRVVSTPSSFYHLSTEMAPIVGRRLDDTRRRCACIALVHPASEADHLLPLLTAILKSAGQVPPTLCVSVKVRLVPSTDPRLALVGTKELIAGAALKKFTIVGFYQCWLCAESECHELFAKLTPHERKLFDDYGFSFKSTCSGKRVVGSAFGEFGNDLRFINDYRLDTLQASCPLVAPSPEHTMHEVKASSTHKTSPNCQFGEASVNGVPFAFVFARQDIADGQPLSIDYGEGYWSTAQTRRNEENVFNVQVEGALREAHRGRKGFAPIVV